MYRNLAHARRPGVSVGTAEAVDALLDAMRADKIETDEAHRVVANTDKYCRFHVIGDKKGSRNGLARLFVDQYGARGSYGSNKEGFIKIWHMDDDVKSLTPAERRERVAAIERAKRQHEREVVRLQTIARKRAERIWKEAKPCSSHPYLARKRVGAHGLRLWHDALVVPAYDSSGRLWTLEFVRADGSKKFLTDGRKMTCYYPIGRFDGKGDLLVCEGFATGASLREAKKKPVAVAFDAGNLLVVVEALHKKYPSARIVVCADNDAGDPKNPGRTKGKAAAEAVGGVAVIPADGYNDFNDMAVAGVPLRGVTA